MGCGLVFPFGVRSVSPLGMLLASNKQSSATRGGATPRCADHRAGRYCGHVNSTADVVVLGAGPAGLAAAWRAAERGFSVTVLERAPTVGGLAGSFDVGGIRVDHGSHRLHPATPEAIRSDLQRLLGSDLQVRPRNGRLRFAGGWVGFPLRAGQLARAVPPGMLARVAAETATAPLRGARQDTYEAVLRRGLGPTLYGALYGPYAEKLWGLPGDRISGEQARKRVTADTPWKIAARIARIQRGNRRGGQANGQGRIFYYPRRGYGQIAETLADAAVAAGACISTRTAVDSISIGTDDVTVGIAGGDACGAATDEMAARHVFSTIPLPALGAMARPAPSPEVLEAASRLRFRAMVLVYLVHEGGRWTGYDAHYIPGPETRVTRVSEPANYRDSADDPADRSVLCFEVPCAVGDEVWVAGDAELGELAEEALRATGLPPVRVAEVAVRRVPRVYPVYETGFEQDLDGLDAWARSLPTVTTLGRLGLFAHDNSHHAIDMAYAAVDALRQEGFDQAAWSDARARFAEHVVED